MSHTKQELDSHSIIYSKGLEDWTRISTHQLLPKEKQVSQVNAVSFERQSQETLKSILYKHNKIAHELVKSISETLNAQSNLFSLKLHFVEVSQVSQLLQGDTWITSKFGFNKSSKENILLIASELSNQILNRLTGGAGKLQKETLFTDLETVILKDFLQKILKPISRFWNTHVTNIELSQHIFDPDLLSIQDNNLVCLEFLVSINDQSPKKLYLLYPANEILKLISNQDTSSETKRPLKEILCEISSLEIDSRVRFGQTKLSLKQISELQPGDVVICNEHVETPPRLVLNNNVDLPVIITQNNNKLCAQLDQSITLNQNTLNAPIKQEDLIQDTFKEEMTSKHQDNYENTFIAATESTPNNNKDESFEPNKNDESYTENNSSDTPQIDSELESSEDDLSTSEQDNAYTNELNEQEIDDTQEELASYEESDSEQLNESYDLENEINLDDDLEFDTVDVEDND